MVETNVLHLSDLSFGDLVLASEGFVIVNFYVASSVDCQKMGVIIDDLALKYRKNLKFAKFDIEKNSGITSRYKVSSAPTLILFKDGKELDRISGLVTEDKLDEYLIKKMKK